MANTNQFGPAKPHYSTLPGMADTPQLPEESESRALSSSPTSEGPPSPPLHLFHVTRGLSNIWAPMERHCLRTFFNVTGREAKKIAAELNKRKWPNCESRLAVCLLLGKAVPDDSQALYGFSMVAVGEEFGLAPQFPPGDVTPVRRNLHGASNLRVTLEGAVMQNDRQAEVASLRPLLINPNIYAMADDWVVRTEKIGPLSSDEMRFIIELCEKQWSDTPMILAADPSGKSFEFSFFLPGSGAWDEMKTSPEMIRYGEASAPGRGGSATASFDSLQIIAMSIGGTEPTCDSEASDFSEASIDQVESVPAVARQDLAPFSEFIDHRTAKIGLMEGRLMAIGGGESSLLDAVGTIDQFGCVNQGDDVVFREWIAGTTSVSVKGDFSSWEPIEMKQDHAFGEKGDVWTIKIPKTSRKAPKNGDKYQFVFEDSSGETKHRIPATATLIANEEKSGFCNAVCDLEPTFAKPYKADVPVNRRIYEAHLGSASGDSESVGSFKAFTERILPYISKMGYDTILLLGVPEHITYSTFGWHVSSYFAPCSIFGTPDDLVALVDSAHALNLEVWLSLTHSHAAPVSGHGLLDFHGTGVEGYLQNGGIESVCRLFDARKFRLDVPEVLRFLLGSVVHWKRRFGIDGFRVENADSILYRHQGASVDFGQLPIEHHFNHNECDVDGHVYLALFSKICAALGVTSSVASESVYPGILLPIQEGGLGIELIFSSAGRHAVRHVLRAQRDEDFSVQPLINLFQDLSGRVLSVSNWDDAIVARRPLKIAFFTWESMYTHPVGGVAPHVTNLAEGLARLGHEVHIFTRATTASGNHKRIWGVHYHECTFGLHSDFVTEIKNMCGALSSEFFKVEHFMGEQFSIAHSHDWLAAPALTGSGAAGRMTVATIHSTEFGRCGNNSYGGQSRRVADIEAAGVDCASRVITVSGALADEVKSLYGTHPEKIRVLYNGIQAENWDGFEDAGCIKGRYGIPAMSPTFLFVGRMVVQKGPDLLVDAAREVLRHRSDAMFVMVGNGHMLESLKKQAEPLSTNFRWLGAKGGAELKSLFKACDAVVIPSRNEPFGIVVLEAWACYKPVIATTCGGPRDFVTHDVEGYLVDPNPGSIAWGCKKLLDNFDHARWMGERGRVKAAFSFTWDNIAAQTRDVYNELLNRGDCPYGMTQYSDIHKDNTLSRIIIGPDIDTRMSVFDQNTPTTIDRGISLYNMFRLIVTVASGSASLKGGYLSFQGTEFGDPDSLDLPRPGNHFSKGKSFCHYDLVRRTDLKFKYLGYFDACIGVLRRYLQGRPVVVYENIDAKVFVVKLHLGSDTNAYLVSNLHPTNGHERYRTEIKVNDSVGVVISTTEARFGGSEERCGVTEEGEFRIPPRCSFIVAREDVKARIVSGFVTDAGELLARISN